MRHWTLALSGLGLMAAVASAAEPDGLSVKGSFAEVWVPRDEPIAVQLSRPLAAADGQLAILIGETDVTGLFQVAGTVATYDPAVPLPSGETELVVQIVSPGGEWKELARLPLRVLTRRGFKTARTTPTAEVGLKAQLDEGHTPDENAPPRETFEDLALQARLETEYARRGWSAKTTVAIAGASYEQEALRFGQLGSDAPQIDLAGYQAELGRGRATLTLGDVGFGHQRYLVESFSSRGTQLRVGLGSRADASVVAMNGTQIVGWDNFLGVARNDHLIVGGSLGVELLSRPGGLRLEASGVDGSILPEAGYNQGVVNDAVEGRGAGLRLQASLAAQRIRVDSGIAWSEFTNPADPLLEQGISTVPVVETSRDARYANVGVDLLQNYMVTPSRPVTLTLSLTHDRVDPLYASVASVVRADLLQDTYGAAASLGEVTAQYAHTRSEDNLDEVASILKTYTRRDLTSANLPVSAFRKGAASSPWLPVLSYSFERIRQFGAGVPENSDFAASHVPDQLSLNHLGAATWTGERVSFSYRLTHSTQDNRQVGRQNADFRQRTHGGTLALTPRPSFSLSLDAAFEWALAKETGREDSLQRYGVHLDWRATSSLGLDTLVSFTHGEDDKDMALNESTEVAAQAFWLIRPRGEESRPQGRLFLRYARQRTHNRDTQFLVDDERTAWQISAGLSVNAF